MKKSSLDKVNKKNDSGPLAHLAFQNQMSKGRRFVSEEDEDGWMFDFLKLDPFMIDQQKIESSKALRRLNLKQQVFATPMNKHIRNRMSHTVEVASLSALIAKTLGLNVDLCVSIAKGHDVGHLPFGHSGERFVRMVTGKKFHHAAYGAILLQEIERKGRANFSFEVLEGITLHSAKSIPRNKPQEYAVVKLADKIAYVSHDLNDAIRMKILPENAPMPRLLGENQRKRVEKCVTSLLAESQEKGFISFECSEIAQSFWFLHEWMFKNIYARIDESEFFKILNEIFNIFLELSFQKSSVVFGCDPVILISLMSDDECLNLYDDLVFFGGQKRVLNNLSLIEIMPTIRNKKIDWVTPDFSWAKK